MEPIDRYFGSNKKGKPNFEVLALSDYKYLAGRVRQGVRKVSYVYCFYVSGDLDRKAYTEIFREARRIGCDSRIYVFAQGHELIQSPNVMFRRISLDGSRVLDYSGAV